MNATLRRGVRCGQRFLWRTIRRPPLMALALAASACIDRATAPRGGDVVVSVHVGGADPDDGGLMIVVDSTLKQSFWVGYPTVPIHDLKPGTHTIELVRVPPNCTVVDSSVRHVEVDPQQTVDVTFNVECVPTGVAVTIHTTGADMARAYKLLIGDSVAGRPGGNDSVVVSHLTTGTFTLGLVVPLDNCTVSSPSPVVVHVIPHSLITLHFEVACGPRVRVPKIAFVTDTSINGRRGNWIAQVNIDGSNVERLEPGHSPAWSPDGNRLLFSDSDCFIDFYYYDTCNGGLAILDAERWAVARLPVLAGTDPSWSPQADRLAFVGAVGGDLYIARTDGSQPNRIGKSGFVYAHPSWSPDGGRIVYSCVIRLATDLCIVAAIGGDWVVLARAPDDGAPRSEPAWSPDGRRIAFSRSNSAIAIYSLDTDEITSLTEGTEPAWSPDGTRIVFTRPDGLFIVNADGTDLHRLTRGYHSQPAWRP